MSTPSSAENPVERARQLRDQLWFHNERYYNDDAPVISDGQYDALMQELRDLEAEHPETRSSKLAHPADRRQRLRPLPPGPASHTHAEPCQRLQP